VGRVRQVGQVIAFVVMLTALDAAQLLPPPKDGDIRVVHWELRNATDIFLTLEPRSVTGERAPLLTFTHRFPGTRQTAAPIEVEVQAFAGQFWAPRAELWFEIDGREIFNLGPPLPGTSLLEGTSDYWSGRMPIDVARRMARAKRINGGSLGFPFELTASQRLAIRTWVERITPRT
jgi:hypothetical protein